MSRHGTKHNNSMIWYRHAEISPAALPLVAVTTNKRYFIQRKIMLEMTSNIQQNAPIPHPRLQLCCHFSRTVVGQQWLVSCRAIRYCRRQSWCQIWHVVMIIEHLEISRFILRKSKGIIQMKYNCQGYDIYFIAKFESICWIYCQWLQIFQPRKRSLSIKKTFWCIVLILENLQYKWAASMEVVNIQLIFVSTTYAWCVPLDHDLFWYTPCSLGPGGGLWAANTCKCYYILYVWSDMKT